MNRLTPFLIAILFLAAPLLHAGSMTFNLIGKGGQGLLPTNETTAITGTSGKGGLMGSGISYDGATKVLTINIGWGTGNGFGANLSGPATGAHLHGPTASSFPASYNETGGVLISLTSAPFTFNSSASAGSISGSSIALNATNEAALLAGQLYINVHTSAHSGGEIRANLVPVSGTVPSSLVVLTNGNSGTGSLRQTIADAAAKPGADTITFDPHAFTGGTNNTIYLTTQSQGYSVDFNDNYNVTVDASAIAEGITIDGGLMNAFLFHVLSGGVTLRSLTLGHSGGSVAVNIGCTAALDRCTLAGTVTGSFADAGAILNYGALTLTHCTLSGNHSSGAIYNGKTLTLTHCTLSGNQSTNAGGAIYNDSGAILNLSHTIISGNTATVGADVRNLGTINLSNQNFIGAGISNGSSGSTTGPAPLTGDAMLGPLENNGGPTRTMMPQQGSPCIDPAGGDTTSTFSTDQRSLSRVVDGDLVAGAIVDIGAVEAPNFSYTNKIAFAAAALSFNEEAGTVQVQLKRTGYTSDTASVQVTSSPGSATLADYNAVNTTVNFAANQTTATVDVTLIADPALKEPNESFTLTLSNAFGNSTALGTQTTCMITIIDAYDVTIPTVTVTAPTNNAFVLEANGPVVNLTGSAADNQGLAAVEFSLDGGTYSAATLALNADGKSGSFSQTVNLGAAGAHSIAVRSVDTRGNRSAVTTRSVTYQVVRTLAVNLNASSSGSVSTGFTPTSSRNVGQSYTITATPKAGFVFSGWTANDFTGTGVTTLAAELPTLSFVMQQGLTLTANFIANPFTTLVTGTYNGLIVPQLPTPIHVDTTGFLQNAKVMSNGTFTSTLRLDGLSLPVNGTFNTNGDARFIVGGVRSAELALNRTGKPSLIISLSMTMAGATGIHGTVTQRWRGTDIASSIIDAQLAIYGATSKVPEALAGTTTKPYTLLFPAKGQAGYLGAQYYPQSPGYATMTVNVNGTVSYIGKLADHTAISGSVALVVGNQWPVFISLYGGKGCLVGNATLANANATSYDITGTDLLWVRPLIAPTQWYSDGWADAITLDLAGASYTVPPATPATSVFPGLQAISPNITLRFSGGLLSSTQTFDQTISTANVVTNVPLSTSPTMTITKSIGFVTGSFLHTDGTKPTYQGVILQKGALKGARGYFMSTSPKVLNYLGESGTMSAVAK